jgi:hypothetical protein
MNVLTTIWGQLVRSKLWPLALLLVAALVAVPFLLAKEPEPPVPPTPATAAPAESADADDALAEPVIAKASTEDRSRRRRVLGNRKDPFEPAPVKKPKKTKKVDVEDDKGDTDVKDPGTTGGSGPAPIDPGVVTPKPKKKVYEKGSLIVRFGVATGPLKRMNLKELGGLPAGDDNVDTLLIYTGLTNNGTKAVFLVDASLDATGDGTCQPHPSNCETIELSEGETEFFDVIDPESGEAIAQYELDLLEIK